jgi:hypothetical protein
VDNRATVNGLAVLAAGLMASGLSSFLQQFAILGERSGFARGVLDGLATVAFGVAIAMLVRSRRRPTGRKAAS